MNLSSLPNTLACLAVVAFAACFGLVAQLVRRDKLPRELTLAITILCGAGLLGMVLTDWPLEKFNDFWASHSVLTSLLSSLLLVGVVFLVYEHGEQHKQQRLANGLSGAGLGGIVEAVVDVEVALALLSCPKPPDQLQPLHWADWDNAVKPLRWLREGREILAGHDDPRNTAVPTGQPIATWGQELIDQSVRRLLGAMRDWSPLIGASTDGTEALLLLSDIRRDLMALRSPVSEGDSETLPGASSEAGVSLTSLRIRLRVLALSFEKWSNAPLRGEILDTIYPLPHKRPDLKVESRSLKSRLTEAYGELEINRSRSRRPGALNSVR